MITAIISGTFDPVTVGHVSIIGRAAELFPKVVVAVADSHYKNEMFSAEVRVAAVKAAVQYFENVEVEICEGLVSEFCQKYESPVIVRGARNSSDFEYEAQMAKINSEIMLSVLDEVVFVDTVILPSKPECAHVSSTLVRELIKYGKDFDFYVPSEATKIIKKALKNKNEKD